MNKSVVVFFGLLTFTSCSLFTGNDGKKGEVSLAINWIERPVFYTDTNPAIPANFIRGQFYLTQPGRYSFQYAYDDEFGWEGFYELQPAEPGAKGKIFWKDGRDGKSAFYTMMLSYRGSSLENYYEKAHPDQHEYFIDEFVGGYRIIVHAHLVKLTGPYPVAQNKLEDRK